MILRMPQFQVAKADLVLRAAAERADLARAVAPYQGVATVVVSTYRLAQSIRRYSAASSIAGAAAVLLLVFVKRRRHVESATTAPTTGASLRHGVAKVSQGLLTLMRVWQLGQVVLAQIGFRRDGRSAGTSGDHR